MASGAPSGQVRIPVGDLIFPPLPQLCSHYITWGKKYPATKTLCGGRIIIQRRNSYAAVEAGGPKIQKNLTVPINVAQCRKNPILYLNILRDHSISLYITKTLIYNIAETIPYINTLLKLYPILMHCRNYTLS